MRGASAIGAFPEARRPTIRGLGPLAQPLKLRRSFLSPLAGDTSANAVRMGAGRRQKLGQRKLGQDVSAKTMIGDDEQSIDDALGLSG